MARLGCSISCKRAKTADYRVCVDGVAQAASVGSNGPAHVQREAGPEAALIVQDVAAGAPMHLEIRLQNFSDGVSKDLHRRAGDVPLDEGSKDHSRHQFTPWYSFTAR